MAEENKHLLERKSSALALEFVAADYYTKSWIIQRALNTDVAATDLSVVHRI